ncbi:MAG: collagen-like protein [Flavobacteriales bacterium]|nr:collagen-like protein [Flavobacteriales bacterium]
MGAEVQEVEAQKGDTGLTGDKGDKGVTGAVGASGADGKVGKVGSKGKDGSDGHTGASVASAKIDIDDHLVLTLDSGEELDAGELPVRESNAPTNIRYTGGATPSDIQGNIYHVLESERHDVPTRRQVTIHGEYILEGILELNGTAQLVLEN